MKKNGCNRFLKGGERMSTELKKKQNQQRKQENKN